MLKNQDYKLPQKVEVENEGLTKGDCVQGHLY